MDIFVMHPFLRFALSWKFVGGTIQGGFEDGLVASTKDLLGRQHFQVAL